MRNSLPIVQSCILKYYYKLPFKQFQKKSLNSLSVCHVLIVYDMSTVIYSYALFEFNSCKIGLSPQYNIFHFLFIR